MNWSLCSLCRQLFPNQQSWLRSKLLSGKNWVFNFPFADFYRRFSINHFVRMLISKCVLRGWESKESCIVLSFFFFLFWVKWSVRPFVQKLNSFTGSTGTDKKNQGNIIMAIPWQLPETIFFNLLQKNKNL